MTGRIVTAEEAKRAEEEIKAWADDLRATAAKIKSDDLRDVSEALATVTEQRELANLMVQQQAAQIKALASALARTEANFRSVVNGRPVRDMAENLAENQAALAAVTS